MNSTKPCKSSSKPFIRFESWKKHLFQMREFSFTFLEQIIQISLQRAFFTRKHGNISFSNSSKVNKKCFTQGPWREKEKGWWKFLEGKNGIDLPSSMKVTAASTFCFSGLRQNGYYMSLNHKNTRHERRTACKCDGGMNYYKK